MRLLLDTVAFLMAAREPQRLSTAAREVLGQPANEVYLSAATAWEVAIKVAVGKLNLFQPLPAFMNEQARALGLIELDINFQHAVQVRNLPHHHRDPFDRLLVAQAQSRG
ncbi:MAG: type II toxin-antitoxin system VapC family toxin [Dehalococcoidia bacterium]|nr:type II toxin-antitoxin system VapC family toxin [Dehalococcoidia bacterium]